MIDQTTGAEAVQKALPSDTEAIRIKDWMLKTKLQEQKDRESFVDYYIRAPMLSKPPHIAGFGEDAARVFANKYDTTPDMVSSDTANNFSLGILPSGINSINVRYNDLRESENIATNMGPEIEQEEATESKVLRKHLVNMQFLTGMHQISKEYLDFGYVLTVLEEKVGGGYSLKIPPARDSYLYKDLKHNLFCAAFQERYPMHVAKSIYPKMNISDIISSSQVELTRIFFNFEMLIAFKDSYVNLHSRIYKELDLATKIQLSGGGELLGAGMFEMVMYASYIVQLKFSPYPNVFAASARHLETYSAGYGINAAGAIWLLNWTTGWSIFGVQKIANPSNLLKHNVEITTPEGHTGVIDQTPGATNTVKTGEGAEVPIAEAIQPTTNTPMDLERLTQMNAVGELKLEKAYQTGVYNLQGPAPNETATAFSGRLAQAVRSFRSVSDSFMQQLFLPLLSTINHLVNRENIKQFAQRVLAVSEEVSQSDLLATISTNSYVEKGEHEEKIMKFRMKTELLMVMTQLQANQVPIDDLQREFKRLFPN